MSTHFERGSRPVRAQSEAGLDQLCLRNRPAPARSHSAPVGRQFPPDPLVSYAADLTVEAEELRSAVEAEELRSAVHDPHCAIDRPKGGRSVATGFKASARNRRPGSIQRAHDAGEVGCCWE